MVFFVRIKQVELPRSKYKKTALMNGGFLKVKMLHHYARFFSTSALCFLKIALVIPKFAFEASAAR